MGPLSDLEELKDLYCGTHSAFNQDGSAFIHLWLYFLLRDGQLQDAVFKGCMNIFLSDIITYIKASLVMAGVPFLTDISAFGIFLFFRVLVGGFDREITILQFCMQVFLDRKSVV